jgi:hypothetical protein
VAVIVAEPGARAVIAALRLEDPEELTVATDESLDTQELIY